MRHWNICRCWSAPELACCLSERITHVSATKDDRRELKLYPLKGVVVAGSAV